MKKISVVLLLCFSPFIPFTAFACSCSPSTVAGFIHATTKNLPANARGALFKSPYSNWELIAWIDPQTSVYSWNKKVPITASNFEIKSDTDTEIIPGEISWPDLSMPGSNTGGKDYRFKSKQAELAYLKSNKIKFNTLIKNGQLVDISDQVRAEESIVRIGPIGSFKPGVKYTIKYLGKAESWAFPISVQLTIDQKNVELDSDAYKIILDGNPRRKLLSLITSSGSCTSMQPAIAQDFHYALPASHQAYAETIMFFSFHSGPPSDDFYERPTVSLYTQSLCSGRIFGSTAFEGANDLLLASCSKSVDPVSLVGWAGFLEVEDKLHKTDMVNIGFDQASGSACTGFGILKEALERGDISQISETLCGLGSEEFRDPLEKIASRDLPPMDKLKQFTSTTNDAVKQCVLRALGRLIVETPSDATEATKQYLEMILSSLQSSDSEIIDSALEKLSELRREIEWRVKPKDNIDARKQALFLPILPSLMNILKTGDSKQSVHAGSLIGLFGTNDAELSDQLFSIAQAEAKHANAAMLALKNLLPNEPKFHALLLENFKHSSLLETSALYYAEVAGKENRSVAITMLIKAADNGSIEAIRALGEFKKEAHSAIPTLINRLQLGERSDRDGTFQALINIYNGEKEVIEALRASIIAPPEKTVSSYMLPDLKDLKTDTEVFLPEIKTLMDRSMDQYMKDHIRDFIKSMRLPKREKNDLIEKLDKIKVSKN